MDIVKSRGNALRIKRELKCTESKWKIQDKRIGNSLIHRIWIRKFYKQWYVKEDSHNETYRTNIGSETLRLQWRKTLNKWKRSQWEAKKLDRNKKNTQQVKWEAKLIDRTGLNGS